MDKVRVQSVIVPEVVLIIFAFPVTLYHEVHELGHSVSYVGPERWSKKIEVRVDWAHHFVIWMCGEAFVCLQVGKRIFESHKAMLHQAEAAQPKDCDSWAGKRSPVSVEVHFDCLVENAIATSDCVALDTLSEVSGLFGKILDFIPWSTSVGFKETKKLLIRARRRHSN